VTVPGFTGSRNTAANLAPVFAGSVITGLRVRLYVLLNEAKKMDRTDESRQVLEDRLRRLQAELKERKSSIPIHSIRPHQLIEIEELEEEIEELEKKLGRA
jgi:hypothetical protein